MSFVLLFRQYGILSAALAVAAPQAGAQTSGSPPVCRNVVAAAHPRLPFFCRHIVPCGTPDKEVTSIQKELQKGGMLFGGRGVRADDDSDDTRVQQPVPQLLEVAEQHLVRCIARVYGYTDVQRVHEGELLPIAAVAGL
jgi:hypothetical protein